MCALGIPQESPRCNRGHRTCLRCGVCACDGAMDVRRTRTMTSSGGPYYACRSCRIQQRAEAREARARAQRIHERLTGHTP